MSKKAICAAVAFAAVAWRCCAAPDAKGTPDASVLPSEAHLKYHDCEIMAMVHWGLNTFTGQEWGFGNVPPSKLTPKRLDPEQWVVAMKAAEIKKVVLVAKHHDGFCLWPSKDNRDYSMSAVPAPNTGRDIVRETAEACRKHGLGFGVYLSPWDRHQASYSKPEYIDYFFAQWRDLMDNYGKLDEIWLDGANGGTGWYGGANGGKGERRSIPAGYYRKPELMALLARKHPGAVAFGGGGERSVGWCGNERGSSPETWWCPRNIGGRMYWLPSEADFPLRRGWFWHKNQKPKSLKYLADSYFATVGRGAVMNIGVAPDDEGRVCPDDAARLKEFGDWVREFEKTDFAAGAAISAKCGGNDLEIELALPGPRKFDCIDIREDIAKGQRIKSYSVEVSSGGKRIAAGSGTTVGGRRLHKVPAGEYASVRVKFEGIEPPNVKSISLRSTPYAGEAEDRPAPAGVAAGKAAEK